MKKKIKIRRNKEEYRLHPGIFYSNIQTNAKGKIFKSSQKEGQRHFKQKQCKAEDNVTTLIKCWKEKPVTHELSSGSDSKEFASNVWDMGSIPGLRRSPGEEHGNPLQYSCLENSMGRETWRVTVHGVAKIQTWLSDSYFHLFTGNSARQKTMWHR